MRSTLSRILSALFLCSAATSYADVTYATIADTHAIVTGVRADSANTVVLTANYTSGGVLKAGLYQGSLANATTSGATWYALTPSILINPLLPTGPTQTVTSATFYGPNTAYYDSNLDAGTITAVGSYKYSEAALPNADHGMLYQGPVNSSGTGTWKQIDPNSLVTGPGESLKNTIAHSTMGNLAVGNYDTNLTTGKAFIYNMASDSWTNLNPGGTVSVTAYGIWQNGGSSSTSYTIAGGVSAVNSGGIDQSYLVNYDSLSGLFTNYTTFDFNNLGGLAPLAHFDGITGTATGFNLTGFVTINDTVSGFFTSITVNPDGSFGANPQWTLIDYPSGSTPTITTGNTIVDNNVLGIFISGGATQSYIATVTAVPEPSTYAMLFGTASLFAAVLVRRKRK